jgi:hypothetical protein
MQANRSIMPGQQDYRTSRGCVQVIIGCRFVSIQYKTKFRQL